MRKPTVATDLHGHTLASDGRATPEEYVELRRNLGMQVIAIADHDVMTSVRAGAAASARAAMLFLPAMEVTSFVDFGSARAEQFHVLAYFSPDVLAPERLEQTFLYRRGLRVMARWREFVLEWLASLDEADRWKIDVEGELDARRPEDFPALQAMIDLVVRRHRPMFERFRDHHYRFWNDDYELFGWSPEEAIEAIRGDGAVDIVAHPARYRDKARTMSLLRLASGVEVFTSRHKTEVAAQYLAFAEENGKLWTASADDHQNARYVRPPCGTPVATLERILRRPLPLHVALEGSRAA